MLTEADILPGIKNTFGNISKGSILYVGGKKLSTCPKLCGGKVVQVLHRKEGGENDGGKNYSTKTNG